MLKLVDIVKDYLVAGKSFRALEGVNLTFRDNEFVSILGPSGSGKTTLLNIIGGLDHYTSGNLFIDGVSTKDFSDRDWDNYRNHKVGFIFQSYNLIPHQNVLQNVELALTISGVGKEERQRRAMDALAKVGLGDMLHKRPNQLSGGQCQRVAIARALVNDPSILLADEPTGALDTKTSVQIMDLLKEVAKDRLVIMVTHNPELAEKYSSRIVRLRDGKIEEDSNPYSFEEEKKEAPATKKAKLSLWQAFRLSLQNLGSKAKRTAMVSFAGSIGIVGVSLVLAISSGVQGYLASMQDDMLSGNPVTVSKSALDIESLLSSTSASTQSSIVANSVKEGKVDVNFIIEQLIKTSKTTASSLISNSITQSYVDFLNAMPEEYYNALSYSYGIAPEHNIYTDVTIDVASSSGSGYIQETQTRSLSFMEQFATSIVRQTDYSSYADLVSTYGSPLSQGLDEEKYVLSQYEFVDGGRFAKEENEMVLVLNSKDQVTDFQLTELGFYSQDQFLTVIDKFSDDNDENYAYSYDSSIFKDKFSFEEIKAKDFYYYPNDTIYTPNAAVKAYLDEGTAPSTDDLKRPFSYESIRQTSWGEGMKMKIVGILAPKSGVNYGCLDSGLYYTPSFTKRYMKDNADSYLAGLLNAYSSLAGTDTITTSLTKNPTSGETEGSGIYYEFSYYLKWHEFDKPVNDYGIVGRSSSTSSLFNAFVSAMGIGGASGRTGSLSLSQAGGATLPTSIKIYPLDFDSKYLVTDYLDTWNAEGDVKGISSSGKAYYISYPERKDSPIKYTDNLQLVISMINTILEIVTASLISFTALSLLVSTVMIAIITYVSVIERIKEIGVIRSLGGRKRDVANLFMAETVMVGLFSGTVGIVLTYLLSLAVNLVVGGFTGVFTIASLPWYLALLMIGVSILLTSISGIVPAMSAARKDPVAALRSE